MTDDNVTELNLSLEDTPYTNNKGSNIVYATAAKIRIDCYFDRLNALINSFRKKLVAQCDDIKQLDKFGHEIVIYVNQAAEIQLFLSTSLKYGGETRPWRGLSKRH